MASHASLLVTFLQRKLREEKWNFVSESTLEFKEEVIVVFANLSTGKGAPHRPARHRRPPHAPLPPPHRRDLNPAGARYPTAPHPAGNVLYWHEKEERRDFGIRFADAESFADTW